MRVRNVVAFTTIGFDDDAKNRLGKVPKGIKIFSSLFLYYRQNQNKKKLEWKWLWVECESAFLHNIGFFSFWMI
jgi:hypothetical protein